MMKRNAAFTLVELLIVIAILGVLVTILVPVITGQIEEARRKSCAANLHAIGRKMIEYAHENKGCLPSCTDSQSLTSTSVGYFGQSPGKKPFYSHTRAWFRLVREDYIPADAFVCPSDSDVVPGSGDIELFYDFPTTDDGPPISYSMQKCLYKQGDPPPSWLYSLLTPGGMPIMADMNGLMKFVNKGIYAGDIGVTWQGQRDGTVPLANGPGINSVNHDRDGQNVLTVGGSVVWFETALCGPSGDNIYAPHNGTPGLGINFTRTSSPHDGSDPFLLP